MVAITSALTNIGRIALPQLQPLDMDDIFESSFPANSTASTSAQEQHSAPGEDHALLNDEGNMTHSTVQDEQPLRGKAATQGLTLQEKKERQKLQNRRAAERSRNKKREELTALEMTVNNIQDENNRLRSRLSALLAPKSAEQSHSSADTEPLSGSYVDVGQLAKLQAELASAKASLVDREMELARIRGGDDDDSSVLRQDILHQNTALMNAQAEVKSLHSVIKQLRTDRDALVRQREVVSREIDARRSLREASGESPSLSASARAAGVERALLELRGLVDGVIRSWDQTALLPQKAPDPTS